MRILSLRFKNLNSLKGEFKIDFTDPELSKSGLFAITGPTGAGKSTILDAITLSLYAYIPRFKDVTATTVSEQNAVVTRRTSEAYSELTFEVGGQAYRTNWAIRKARTGNWQQPSFSLSKKNMSGDFEIMTDSIRSTKEKVPEIVGLSSDQFTQAIVLSQGRFDEFLKANKDDRYALLEIITGSDIFRRIGRKAFEKESEVKKNMELLRAELVGLQTLSVETLAEKQREKESLEKNAEDLRSEIDRWSKLSGNRENVVRKRGELKGRQKEQESLDLDWKGFEQGHESLSRHEKAIGFIDPWNQLQSLVGRLEEKRKTIEAYNAAIGKSESDCRRLINELGTRVGESVDEGSYMDLLVGFTQKVKDLDNEIQSLQSRIETERSNAKTYLSVMPDSVKSDLRLIAADSEKLNRYIGAKEDEMKSKPLPEWVEDGKIDEAFELLVRDKEFLKEALNEIRSIEESKKRIGELKASVNEIRVDSGELNNQVAGLQQSLTESDRLIKSIEEEIEKNRAFNAFESYRNQLVEGQPCPCCGSLAHPYAVGLPAQDADVHKTLAGEKESRESIHRTIHAKNAGLAGLERQLKTDLKSIEDGEKSLKASNDRLEAIKGKVVSKYKEGISDIPMCLNDVSVAHDVVSRHREWNRYKKSLRDYGESLENVNRYSETQAMKKTERTALFGQDDIDDFKDLMKDGWSSATTLLNDNRARLEAATVELNRIEEEKDASTKTFQERILGFGFSDLDAFRNSLLDDKVYQGLSKRREQLQNDKVALTARIETLVKELEKAESLDDPSMTDSHINVKLNESKVNLESNREKIGSVQKELDMDARNRRRHDELMIEYKSAESKHRLYSTLNSYIGDRDGDKFNRIVQRLTVQHLFGMANRRMRQLMDRYRIELADGTDDIWLTDLYMGGERRTIDSASGGERFIISLALALSLSEMASMNVKIDSMFIDEGFGSLSPDELYQAIDMLERLQVENEKMVGIISHVESLKERITTQIVARKLQEGESTLVLKVLDNERSLKIAG